MTNLFVLIVGMMFVETNRVESIHPSGERMTLVEEVTAKIITPIAFEGNTTLVTNVVGLRTNATELVRMEIKIPHPGLVQGSALKFWRPDPLNVRRKRQ